MILAFTGRKCSGKDTAYFALKSTKFNVKRFAFADKVKAVARTLFNNIDVDNKDGGYVTIGEQQILNRDLLKFIGLKFRELHADIWVDLIVNEILEAERDGFVPVITDARFPNEIEIMKRLGAKIIRVIRPSLKNNDDHISEKLCDTYDVDFEISNDGLISEYMNKVIDLAIRLRVA